MSPHTSRFLLTAIGSSFGAAPTNFTTPLTTPPSATATSSYAAPVRSSTRSVAQERDSLAIMPDLEQLDAADLADRA